MPEFRQLLDVSPTGVQHEIVIEDDTLYTVEYTPSSIESDILDSCAQMRSMSQRSGNFQLAARIPINTYMAWKKEWRREYAGTMSWSEFEVMKLNSRENCQLRTGKGDGVYGKRL